jgi:hypothetical protein
MTQENLIPFCCNISTSDASVPLGMRVTLNDQVVFENLHITEPVAFKCLIAEDDQQYVLAFEMLGKTHAHTIINDAGEILQDACLILKNFSIDEIELHNTKLFEYEHDFNGASEKAIHPFYELMGCNGRLIVKFSTPIYLWLLENM